MTKPRFRLTLELGRASAAPSRAPPRVPRHAPQAADGGASKRKLTRRIALAVLVPLLLVTAGWATGLIYSPWLEEHGIHPPIRVASAEATAQPVLHVHAPGEGETLREKVIFQGTGKAGGTVAFWVKGTNIPVNVQVDSGGAWAYEFDTTRLTQGGHTLQFGMHDGKRWSSIVERHVTIERAAAGEAAPGPAQAWVQGAGRALPTFVGTPLLAIGQPIAKVVDSISITVTGARGSDLDGNGVSDWVESGPVNPTRVSPRLSPIIESPRWVNLFLIVAAIVLPVVVLILRDPKAALHLAERVGRWTFLVRRERAQERLMGKRLGVERERIRGRQDLARQALYEGSKASREAEKLRATTNTTLTKLQAQTRVAVAKLEHDARVYEARAKVAEGVARTRATEVAQQKRLQIAQIRREEAEARARSKPSTVINLGAKRTGAFRSKSGGR